MKRSPARTRLRPVPSLPPLVLMASILLAWVVVPGCSDSPFESWPPRTGENDALADASGVSVEVMHVIPGHASLRMEGRRDLAGAQFLPVEGEFRVLGGDLTSALGAVHRKATFTEWTLFYTDETRQEIAGWGPCLTRGEAIVPNVFLAEPAPGRWVPNAFAAEDVGEYHTLVRLDESRGDRLCFGYRPADGMGYEGNLSATGRLDISGQVDPDLRPSDRLLYGTAGDAGSRVRTGEHLLEHRADGWWLGDARVGPPADD